MMRVADHADGIQLAYLPGRVAEELAEDLFVVLAHLRCRADHSRRAAEVPEIAGHCDLAGKKIGIVSLGGAHEVSLVLALKEWNIPRQSVTLLASGPAANRLVGLSAGALDATLLAPPETGEAMRMGLPTLAHMTELKAAHFPMNAIATRRSFMEKNRDVIKRFLRAYAAGIHQFMTSKEKGVAMLTQRMKQKNPAVVEETYQYFASTFSFPPRMSHEGMRAAIEMLQQRSPETKFDTNVGKYVDERLMDELEKEGFFKRIGGKG